MGKNIAKNISKNLTSKYSKKILVYAKQSATDGLKIASKRTIQKTDDLIGNKIANKIIKKSPQNTSETVESETKISNGSIHTCQMNYKSPKLCSHSRSRSL